MSHTLRFIPVKGRDPHKADKRHRNQRERRQAKREEQCLLFAVPFVRKPRRVMMHFTDAGPGNPNCATFRCGKCGHETGWLHDVTNQELRQGRPCPVCNGEVAA